MKQIAYLSAILSSEYDLGIRLFFWLTFKLVRFKTSL